MATVETNNPYPELGESHDGSDAQWAYLLDAMQEFRKHSDELEIPIERSRAAIDFAQAARQVIGVEDDSRVYSAASRRPQTQLSAIEWAAWNELWMYSGQKEIDGVNVSEQEYLAKQQLLDEIDAHAHISRYDASAYSNLLDSLYLARLVVKRTEGLASIEKNIDVVALAQMLNIHKLIGGLRESGFSRTRRATKEERDSSIGVVVPFGQSERVQLNIKVQPGFNDGSPIVTQQFNQWLLVDIPYYGAPNPFELEEPDRQIVAEAVKRMRAQLLGMEVVQASKADTLQTEVV